MHVSLRDLSARVRAGAMSSADGVASALGWLFLGTIVPVVATDAWRQAHGGVGYLNDYTPCVGVALALLPAPFSRQAALDGLVQRLSHALIGAAYLGLTWRFVGDYASLARSASDGTPYFRDPAVLAAAAAMAVPAVWALARYATRAISLALAAVIPLAAPAALVAGLFAVVEARHATSATALLRGAPVELTLAPPSVWPSRASVRRLHDPRLPWDVEARCERWYCAVRAVRHDAPLTDFATGFAPTLSPSAELVARRPRGSEVWFLAAVDGGSEVAFATAPRYASLVDLCGRASMPLAWALASLLASIAAIVVARRARARRASALQRAWEWVTVSDEGVVTDAWKDELDVVCERPPPGVALAIAERVLHPGVYRDAAPPRRVVAWVPGDRDALVAALDISVAEADARALSLLLWGVGPAVVWALRVAEFYR